MNNEKEAPTGLFASRRDDSGRQISLDADHLSAVEAATAIVVRNRR